MKMFSLYDGNVLHLRWVICIKCSTVCLWSNLFIALMLIFNASTRNVHFSLVYDGLVWWHQSERYILDLYIYIYIHTCIYIHICWTRLVDWNLNLMDLMDQTFQLIAKVDLLSFFMQKVPGPGTYEKTYQAPIPKTILKMGRQHGIFFSSAFQVWYTIRIQQHSLKLYGPVHEQKIRFVKCHSFFQYTNTLIDDAQWFCEIKWFY